MCFLSSIPFVFFKEDPIISKLIWMVLIIILALIVLFSFFYHKQYLLIENDEFVLKNLFMVIKRLKIYECYYEVEILPTYYSWVNVINEKWICLYLKNDSVVKFKNGVSNSKKYDRIQIIYNKENLDFIKSVLN